MGATGAGAAAGAGPAVGSPVTELPREPGAIVPVLGQSEHGSVLFPPAGSVARSCS